MNLDQSHGSVLAYTLTYMGRKETEDEQPFETTLRAQFRNRQAYEDFANGRHHSDKGLRGEKGHLTSQPDLRLMDDDAASEESPSSNRNNEQYVYVQNVQEESNPIAAGIAEGLIEVIVDLLEDPQVQAFLKQAVRKAGAKLGQFAGKTRSFIKAAFSKRSAVADSLFDARMVDEDSSDSEEVVEAEIVVDDEPVAMTDIEYTAKQNEAQNLEKAMRDMWARLVQVRHDLNNATITPEEAAQITKASVQQLPPQQLLELENTCQSSGVDLRAIIGNTPDTHDSKVQ
jgi:hypothetical protein